MRRLGKYIGIPFVYAKHQGNEELDCYGIIRKLYNDNGYKLPILHYTKKNEKEVLKKHIGKYFEKIDKKDIGCLIVFEMPRNKIHLALYAGSGKMLHSTRQGSVISDCERWTKKFNHTYWRVRENGS